MNYQPPKIDCPQLAIVVPCYNEEPILYQTIEKLRALCHRMVAGGIIVEGSFILFVDDGSQDNTWELISAAHRDSRECRGIRLSKNFGHQNALLAGLMAVVNHCDIAVSIDADLQQDPEAIPKFIQEYRGGAEVVLGIREDRLADGWGKKVTAQFYYRFMNFMGAEIIPNHADYRLMSSRALKWLTQYSEPNLFLRAACSQMSLRTATVHFRVYPRAAGKTKYSLGKMFKLALDSVVSFSTAPLRMITFIGLAIFVFSAAMGCYVVSDRKLAFFGAVYSLRR